MNNKTGRPRNTAGSLYLRRDSRVWWMNCQDHNGKFRQESTGRKEKGEAEKVLRKRLVARNEGLLPSAATDAGITFNQWADWFLKNRSQSPFRNENTHLHNLGALKFLRSRFGKYKLSDITVEEIESYLIDEIEQRQAVVYQVRAATSRPAQTGHRAQGDSQVFKRYSQAKLNMMRESLSKLDRQANEHGATSFTALAG